MYYRVRYGDTLSGIAQAFTGNANNYWSLAAYNGIANPNYILAGQVIYIPMGGYGYSYYGYRGHCGY